MSVATLTSRATGLIRTMVMAFALGNTLVTSAYQVANNMPNMIFDLVAGGLLNAAFIPLYLLQIEKHGRDGGNRYASNLLNIVIVVMGLLSVLATIFAPQIIATQTFTLNDNAPVNAVAVDFFRIFAFQLLFYGIGGVITCILNANRIYFLPSIAPAFNNIVVIVSFIAYSLIAPSDSTLALTVLAVGTTLGVVAQFAVQLPALIKQGFKYVPRIDFKDPGFIATIKTGIPMIIYLVGTLVAFSFRNAFALASGDNGPSTLIYAWTWFQLPHGIIAVSLSRALFTEMSNATARDDLPTFKRFMRSGISGTLLVVIPLAGMMCVLAVPLMQIFKQGQFNADDVTYVASVLSIWVLALPVYSLQMYLFNVFAALRRFGTFCAVCTSLCALQCLLYALLTAPELLGLGGVPVADIVYYAATTLILLVVLRRFVGSIGGRAAVWTALRTLAATLVGVALVWAALTYVPLDAVLGTGRIGGLVMVLLYGGVALVLVFALCRLMRVPEMQMVTALLGRVLRRRQS
jgi:putative peptidoglycan lipid II flippase